MVSVSPDPLPLTPLPGTLLSGVGTCVRPAGSDVPWTLYHKQPGRMIRQKWNCGYMSRMILKMKVVPPGRLMYRLRLSSLVDET